MPENKLPNPYLSPGTHVVTHLDSIADSGKLLHPKEAVAIVNKVLADNRYRVRFLDGYEMTFSRDQLTICKHYLRAGQTTADAPTPLL